MAARIDLQLADDEFYELTYREFHALWERWTMRRWQAEYVLGSIASAIYATGFARPKDVPKPDVFCFTPRPGEPPKHMERMSRQDIASVFRALAARPETETEGK